MILPLKQTALCWNRFRTCEFRLSISHRAGKAPHSSVTRDNSPGLGARGGAGSWASRDATDKSTTIVWHGVLAALINYVKPAAPW